MAYRIDVQVVWVPTTTFVAHAFFASVEQLRNLGPAMEQIVEVASGEIAANFAAEGRPGSWEPLAEATIRKRGSSHPILEEFGALVSDASDPSAWDISISGQAAVAALGVPEYGRFHLTGTVDMPERVWDYISPEAEEEMDQILVDHMEAPLVDAGWH